MKKLLIGSLVVLATWSTAEAKKNGNPDSLFSGSYDYKREKAPGYVKDYCLDSVGNHVYCTSSSDGLSSNDMRFRATVQRPARQ